MEYLKAEFGIKDRAEFEVAVSQMQGIDIGIFRCRSKEEFKMKRKQRLRLRDAVKLCAVGAAAVYMVSGISDVAEEAAKRASIQAEAVQIIALPVE